LIGSKHTYFKPVSCLIFLPLIWFTVAFAAPKPITGKHTFFTQNKGQWDRRYLYKAEIGNGTMLIEKDAFQYFLVNTEQLAAAVRHPKGFWENFLPKKIDAHAMRVSFIHANDKAWCDASEPMPFYHNYFLGDNPEYWATAVPSYRTLTTHNLYRGIDLKLYARPDAPLKYDLIIKPGATASTIQLQYDGANEIRIRSGYLYIKTSVGTVVEKKPYAYQVIDGYTREVSCAYALNEDLKVGFTVGAYNAAYDLIIDPELIFSTYSGSTADNFGATATYDSEGNLYSAGITESVSFGKYPTKQGAFQINSSGGVNGSWPQNGFACDITISKYNNDGTQLLYATYLGGTQNDYAHSLVVDRYDQLIVLGSTLSKNFPTSTNAFDKIHNDSFDITLTKFSKNGTVLIGSTYIGGNHSDGISICDTLCMGYMDHMRGEVIVDRSNDILIGSVTSSLNFPVTFGAYQTAKSGVQDGCIVKLDSALTTIKWSTFLGDTFQETLNALDVDVAGNIYAVGGTHSKYRSIKGPVFDSAYHGGYADAYIAYLSSDGSTLNRFKYWGSTNYDQSFFVKVHNNGDVYMLGQNFDSVPVTPGVYVNSQGTINICAFSKNLDTLRFSTRIGNTLNRNVLVPSAFMVDICGNVYASIWAGPINISNSYRTGGWLVNATSSASNLPITVDALQSTTDNQDFFLFQLAPGLTNLLYGTYMGEISGADHVDGGTSRFDHRGIVYQSFCASCNSGIAGTFPTTANSYAPKNLSQRCSNASMKLDFRKSNIVIADFSIQPRRSCTDTFVRFINNSWHGVRFRWYVNDVLKDSSYHYADTFHTKGSYAIKLVVVDSTRCNIIDSVTKILEVQTSTYSAIQLIRDTCSSLVHFKNFSGSDDNQPLTYLWQFGDGDTSTAFQPSHLYNKNGTYSPRLITNPGSFCADTASKTFTYDSTSQILKASLFVQDSVGCEPAQIHINNTSYNGKQFYWYINNKLAFNSYHFDSLLMKGNYTIKLVVRDSATCLKADSVTKRIYIYPDVIPDFSIKRDSCSLTVSFTNLSSTLPGDSVVYVWFFGDGDSSKQTHPVHTFPNPGWYKIQLFTNPRLLCVKQKDIWYFLDNNKNVLEAKFTPDPSTGCRPANIQFNNNSINGSRFYWYLDGILTDSSINFIHTFDSTGTFQVKLIAIDSASCHKSDSLEQPFTVLPYAKANFTIHRDTCSPVVQFINLTDTLIYKSPAVYRWHFGDGDSATGYHVSHTYIQNGSYIVKLITNPFTACADSMILPFDYDSLSHIIKANFILNDSTLCLPAFIRANNTSVGGLSNRWYVNNLFADSTFNFLDTISVPGTYSVTLITQSPLSCKGADTLTKTISVNPASSTSFTLARDSCSLLVQFTNTSNTGGLTATWSWNFGDGDSSAEASPKHQYRETGLYTIRLITNAGTYCADSAEQSWFLDGDTVLELMIPNVFTPNGDLHNDCYTVRGVSPKCDKYHIWIRNRWGNLFFESTDPTVCWNGTNAAGELAAEGVYFYIIKIIKQSGLHIDKAGTVTLIRD
jgi:gliding motility-associated-like protein